jgi:glycolate oxidase iron-sulfur subunit
MHQRTRPPVHEERPTSQLDLFGERICYEIVEGLKAEIERCLKCGLCRSVCPVFAEVLDESGCARGRIALIEGLLENRLSLSEVFSDRLSKCLNCKACMDACPSGIRVDELVLGARAEIFNKGRFPLLKKLIFRHLLKRGRLLPPVGKFIAFIERKILRSLPPSSPYRMLLPIVKIDKERILPVFAQKTLMEQYGEIISPKRKPRMRVGYFVGCSGNLIYTQIGQAVIRVLVGEGIEVVLPHSQGCCGVPVYTAGDRQTGRELALSNIKAFKSYKLDAIVTACASGGIAFKNDYEKILGFKTGALGAKVYDISEFLSEFSKLEFNCDHTNPVTVTYHDPCHLSRGQGIRDAPRRVLNAIPYVKFVEMEEADRCCGGGGMFTFTHYDIAKAIGRRKASYIAATEADVLATSCPSCMMQLEDMLRRNGLHQKVMHLAELVAPCYPPLEVARV